MDGRGKETREAYLRHLAEITYFDGQVGELPARLEASGRSRETLVMVLSDQGSRFPFAKWRCNEARVGSGGTARWPGRVKGGTVSDVLVEYVDVVPTFLEAAGAARQEGLDHGGQGGADWEIQSEGKAREGSVLGGR